MFILNLNTDMNSPVEEHYAQILFLDLSAKP